MCSKVRRIKSVEEEGRFFDRHPPFRSAFTRRGFRACIRFRTLQLQHGQFAGEADFDVGFDRGERFNRISTDNRLSQFGVVLV
jgi:hypothetical protein